MKVVILAGGLGTRLAEETEVRPKPMVEIGGRPILWHIMKHYAHHGFNEFFVALGYKGEVDQALLPRLRHAQRQHDRRPRPAGTVAVRTERVRGLDRAPDRHRARHHTRAAGSSGSSRCLGDGDLHADLRRRRVATSTCEACFAFHRSHGKHRDGDRGAAAGPLRRAASSTATGDGRFTEKPQAGEGWINGGFIVFEPEVFDYLDGDADEPGGRGARAAGRRRPARRLPARRLLAVHGHAPGQERSLESLWQRGPGAVEGLAMSDVLAGSADVRDRRHRAGRRWLVRRLLDAARDVVCLVRDWVPQ